MAKFNLIESRWSYGVLDEQEVIASFDSEKEADEACNSAQACWAYHHATGGVSFFYEEVEDSYEDNSYSLGYAHACGYHD